MNAHNAGSFSFALTPPPRHPLDSSVPHPLRIAPLSYSPHISLTISPYFAENRSPESGCAAVVLSSLPSPPVSSSSTFWSPSLLFFLAHPLNLSTVDLAHCSIDTDDNRDSPDFTASPTGPRRRHGRRRDTPTTPTPSPRRPGPRHSLAVAQDLAGVRRSFCRPNAGRRILHCRDLEVRPHLHGLQPIAARRVTVRVRTPGLRHADALLASPRRSAPVKWI